MTSDTPPRCARCNGAPASPVTHGTRTRVLCERCCRVLHVTLTDTVRSGVDYHLASDPHGPVIGAIRDILAGGESELEYRRRWA